MWWDLLQEQGPKYGYYVNATKTWLLVKPSCLQAAEDEFADTGVQITTNGVKHLGAPLGDRNFTTEFVSQQVLNWTKELSLLSEMASSQPHLAYSALAQGMMGKWVYLSRTVHGIADLFEPLEALLKDKFIPIITGHSPPSDSIRDLFALPTNCGGLGITKPTDLSLEFEISEKVSAPLVALIVSEQTTEELQTMNDCVLKQKEITAEMQKSKRERLTSKEMKLDSAWSPLYCA